MATLADSLVSSSSRSLTLRMRPDLSARQQRYHGRTYWVVKEPVGLNYFRFHEEEYAILCMLDGHSSLEDIKERFEREFTPQKISFGDLQQFVGMLHRSGLVISDASGQGQHLKKRRDQRRRRELMGKASNIFAVRFRGIDPERVLNWLLPYTWWLFTKAAATFFLLFGLLALGLVMVQFDVFRSRLPSFHEFFGPANWPYLGVTLGLVKVIHEFGHGLSCKRFGGECHEMGFMFLVFTPCLYCNVSDSWMLPNKWHRVVIGAAGMYFEVIMASVATFLWWFSEPGMLNHISLSVMFICSVSTLLFNGNPLLRFDGYYILMDISEIPNLRQKSTEVLKRFMTELCLGIEQPENPFLPQGNHLFFALYTIAAVMYRWIVVFSILMFLNSVLEPYGLKRIGQAIAAAGLFGLVIQPIWKLGQFFYVPGRMHKVKKPRLFATLAVAALAILFVVFVPLPYHVDSSFTIEPRGAAVVFAAAPGRLVDVRVKPGMTVEAGDLLARMENVDLQLEKQSLEGNLEQVDIQLATLRRQRGLDERIGRQLGQYEELSMTVQEQIVEVSKQLEQLTIEAPASGTILPAPHRPAPPTQGGRLPTWSGTPLDPENEYAMLGRGDVICRVGDPTRLEAILVIDQADVDFVKPGDKVEILLDAFAHESIDTTIEAIADEPIQQTPPSLAIQAGGRLDTYTDKSGVLRPLSTSYPASSSVDDDSGVLQIGMRGQAKIYTGWRSLGSRIYRYLARTFHFEL